jgi:hypothetical protein
MPRLPMWVMTDTCTLRFAAACASPIPLDSRNARGGNQFLREPRLPFAVFASNANEMCGPTNAASVPVNERRKLFLNPGNC